MHLKSRFFAGLGLVLGLCLFADPSLWAGSKSASIRISCTINPMLEISSNQALSKLTALKKATPSPEERKLLGLAADGMSINVMTNSGQKYQFAQNLWKTQKGNVKLYSVTAV